MNYSLTLTQVHLLPYIWFPSIHLSLILHKLIYIFGNVKTDVLCALSLLCAVFSTTTIQMLTNSILRVKIAINQARHLLSSLGELSDVGNDSVKFLVHMSSWQHLDTNVEVGVTLHMNRRYRSESIQP